MKPTTYQQFYTYSWFANLAYVRWDSSKTASPQAEVDAAAADKVFKVPTALGNKIFRPAPDGQGWTIPSPDVGGVYPDDPDTGFAANLFVNSSTHEKVLAIRGTESDLSGLASDLIQADFLGVGLIGVALSQAVSLYNYVTRLINPLDADVTQVRVVTGVTPPDPLLSPFFGASRGQNT